MISHGVNSQNWTLVRGAHQLLTLHRHAGVRRGGELAELGLIPDGSVLIHDGVIEAVGPTRRIENMTNARKAEEIDASGRVVMPAFVDPHACLVPVPGCRDAVKPVQALPATRLEAQADELLKIMARHGTATIGALSGYGGDATGELKILRALRARDRKPLDIVSIFSPKSYGNEGGEELLHCVARRKLAGIAAVRRGEGGESQAAAAAFVNSAQSQGFAVRMEIAAEPGSELVASAVNWGAMSLCAAGSYGPGEIELLRDSSIVTILLPEMLARKGLDGSARALIDNGAAVALASGLNPHSVSTGSMQTVVQTACDALGLSLAEAICAATVNAAWALGVGGQTGALEHGKLADLIVLNAGDYREIPLLAGTNLTHAMLKRGVVLFKEDFPGWPERT